MNMSQPLRGESSVLAAIKNRRSVRHFSNQSVSEDLLNQILESGRWAPSGKNNQPWKFAVLKDEFIRKSLATLTHYGHVVRNAPVCIAVFLDHTHVYDRTKDVQAIGACIQNMLLTIHALGLGGVWLGEILKNRERVEELLEAQKEWELMAVIALGYPAKDQKASGKRDPLEEKIFLRR